jgi:cyclopropane fatty-acyl-phospholipid synthase-like methyltransferase
VFTTQSEAFTTRSDDAARLVDIWCSFRSVSGPAHVLDLGCGTGGVAMLVARGSDGSTAVGLDIAQRNIDKALKDAQDSGLSQRAKFVCSSYEKWKNGTFDAILSDSVLHIIDMNNATLARRLAANLVGGGLLIATMPDSSLGNFLRINIRRLWRAAPAAFDRVLLALAKRIYPQFSAQMLTERLSYMRVMPVRVYDAAFAAALASAGLERVAELPWPSPSVAKLRHCVLVWRRCA